MNKMIPRVEKEEKPANRKRESKRVASFTAQRPSEGPSKASSQKHVIPSTSPKPRQPGAKHRRASVQTTYRPVQEIAWDHVQTLRGLESYSNAGWLVCVGDTLFSTSVV